MENKIQELTEKLLNEGVEKGKVKAQEIIDAANLQAQQIVENAKKEAESIKVDAEKNAQTLDKNTKSELKMAAEQAISALKTEITNVLNDKISAQVVGDMVNDKKVMNDFILKLAETWGKQEDIKIQTNDAENLKKVFLEKAKALLDKKVKIEQVNGKNAQFTIIPQNGSYKVNFGDEEFQEFFKDFLRPQLVEMLF